MSEGWPWKKFILGFFDGRNYGKAIVLGVCGAIVITLCYSTYKVISNKFQKATVTTNQGVINNEEGNTWSLFNIFNWR